MNFKNNMKILPAVTLILLGFGASHATSFAKSEMVTTAPSPVLDAIANGKSRTEKFQTRDEYRHPAETLTFLGIKDTMTVVELWQGGGWYTEILAPYLKEKGQYIAAHYEKGELKGYRVGLDKKYRAKLAAQPEFYSKVKINEFGNTVQDFGKEGSADMILTFRNYHNWMKNGFDKTVVKAAFAALKPGGIFGVVEHRLNSKIAKGEDSKGGYVSVDYIVKTAKAAGFVLEASSEINANSQDTSSHPSGVWTLPPVLALGEKDRAKYLAIGESDRMTLKFVKPSK